jgi:hypothetical protein
MQNNLSRTRVHTKLELTFFNTLKNNKSVTSNELLVS